MSSSTLQKSSNLCINSNMTPSSIDTAFVWIRFYKSLAHITLALSSLQSNPRISSKSLHILISLRSNLFILHLTKTPSTQWSKDFAHSFQQELISGKSQFNSIKNSLRTYSGWLIGNWLLSDSSVMIYFEIKLILLLKSLTTLQKLMALPRSTWLSKTWTLYKLRFLVWLPSRLSKGWGTTGTSRPK